MLKAIAVLGAVLVASTAQAATIELGSGEDGMVESSPDSLLLYLPIDSVRIDGVERTDIRGNLQITAGERSHEHGSWYTTFYHAGPAAYTVQLVWGGQTGTITGTLTSFSFRIQNPQGEAALTEEISVLPSPVVSPNVSDLLGGTLSDGEFDWLADSWYDNGYAPTGYNRSRIYPYGIYHIAFDVTPKAVPAPPILGLLLAAGLSRRLFS